MDKLIETPWFIKLIAFLLAVLLFISINFEPESDTSRFNVTSSSGTEVIEAVPVEVYYDRDNLVVTGVPKTVDVTLDGPKNLVLQAKNTRDFKVYIDLSDSEIELGERRINFNIRGLNDKISHLIDPEFIDISIEEKVTKEFTVEPEFDRNLLEEGYIAKEPQIVPNTVNITGAKSIIEKIVYVKAIIHLEEGVHDTVTLKAEVQALDRNLNKLDVSIDPEEVEVEVPIISPSKTMDIEPVESGKPKEGITIQNISVEPSEITLYGKKAILDAMENFQIPVDVSKIEESTEFKVEVDLPEGITTASTTEVTIKITVENTQDSEVIEENEQTEEVDISKTFSNFSITSIGLDDNLELTFNDPRSGKVNITITGKENDVQKVKPTDLQVSIDVTGLDEGDHTKKLKLNAPSSIRADLSSLEAEFSIVKKEV